MTVDLEAYTDHECVVRGMRFHYLEWGRADAPPMLLLHGGLQTAHSWDFFSAAMAEQYRVIALDQRGHGDSARAPDGDYGRAAQQRDIHGVVEQIGLERFILIGLSMGGANSIIYTATHPERVRALVIVDVGPEIEREGVQNIRRFAAGPEELDSFEEFVELAHQFNPRRPKERLRQTLKHNLAKRPNGRWGWKWDPAFRQFIERSEREGQVALSEYLPRISCPTLIVLGAKSDVLTAEAAERLRAAIAGSELVTVENAGHTVPGDNPPGFEAAVRPFLARLG